MSVFMKGKTGQETIRVFRSAFFGFTFLSSERKVPVGNPNRTHFTGKIPGNTYETSLMVLTSTISLRFARLSS